MKEYLHYIMLSTFVDDKVNHSLRHFVHLERIH